MTNSWGRPPEDVIPLRSRMREAASSPPQQMVCGPWRWNGERWELAEEVPGTAGVMPPASSAVRPGAIVVERGAEAADSEVVMPPAPPVRRPWDPPPTDPNPPATATWIQRDVAAVARGRSS